MTKDTRGPFIVWEYFGYEGWHPTSYPTLLEAVTKGGMKGDAHVLTHRLSLAQYLGGAPQTPVDVSLDAVDSASHGLPTDPVP